MAKRAREGGRERTTEWSNPLELRLTFPFYNRDIPDDGGGAAPNAYAAAPEQTPAYFLAGNVEWRHYFSV